MTTVHNKPEYQLRVATKAPFNYPQEAHLCAYSTTPFASTFAERREVFLAYILQNPSPLTTKAVYYELARLTAGGPIHPGIITAACDYVDARKDCADFTLHSLLRLLYSFRGHAAVGEALTERCEQSVLNFKYWPDEPGIDSLCTWTENHHILFSSGAYLAGQMFPEKVFSNSGHTGLEKMAIHKPRIERWLDLRFHTGFSEWLSHVYYDEDLTALLSLVDFCADPTIAHKAAQVIDLILLDIALNSFKGVFGSSHGRSYENTKKWVRQEGTIDTARLLFGMGEFSSFDNMSAPVFALSRYRVPEAIEAIAADSGRAEMLNHQRMGICLDDAQQWGLGYQSFEDGMTYLTLEAYAHPRTIGLVMRMFDAYHWWENSFFQPMKRYQLLLRMLRRLGLLGVMARFVERDACRNTREQVNVETYRTPDYMLSTAQDYRKGYGGDQQHIWQATLGPDAVCFTTHPARLEGASPSYWTGSGLLPRAAQVKNVALIVYKLEKIPAVYNPVRLFYTHAWLPRDSFDQVVERGGWVFARKAQGYLALRSQQPTIWSDTAADGHSSQFAGLRGSAEDSGRELAAPGAENIWICELGRSALDGPFEQFIDRILAAELVFEKLHVRYHSPSQGWLEFGWEGDLLHNGAAVALGGYPRYDNPYLQAAFGTDEVHVQCGEICYHTVWAQGHDAHRTDGSTNKPSNLLATKQDNKGYKNL